MKVGQLMKGSGNLPRVSSVAILDIQAFFEQELERPRLLFKASLVNRWIRGFEDDFYLWLVIGWRYRHVHLYNLSSLRGYQLCGRLFYHLVLSQAKSQSEEFRQRHLVAYYFCIRVLADLNLMFFLLDENRNGHVSLALVSAEETIPVSHLTHGDGTTWSSQR